MFRKMRRFKQQIPEEEYIEILKNELRGVLSVLGDDGYPYGIPLDYWMKSSFSRVCCLELVPDHMTGKLVNEV